MPGGTARMKEHYIQWLQLTHNGFSKHDANLSRYSILRRYDGETIRLFFVTITDSLIAAKTDVPAAFGT